MGQGRRICILIFGDLRVKRDSVCMLSTYSRCLLFYFWTKLFWNISADEKQANSIMTNNSGQTIHVHDQVCFLGGAMFEVSEILLCQFIQL